MKRIRSQYLLQTLHFLPDPKLEKELGLKKMQKELEDYKSKLGEDAKIVKEETLDDKTVLLKVKKKLAKPTASAKEKQE